MRQILTTTVQTDRAKTFARTINPNLFSIETNRTERFEISHQRLNKRGFTYSRLAENQNIFFNLLHPYAAKDDWNAVKSAIWPPHTRYSGTPLTFFVRGQINPTVSGPVAFVQAHPTEPAQEIIYIALEGNEAGTCTRGSAQLKNGIAEISLPEDFALVTSTNGLTVQVIPRGPVRSMLYVVSITPQKLVVKPSGYSPSIEPGVWKLSLKGLQLWPGLKALLYHEGLDIPYIASLTCLKPAHILLHLWQLLPDYVPVSPQSKRFLYHLTTDSSMSYNHCGQFTGGQ